MASAEAISIVDIAQSGADLILTVGTKKKKQKLRVSSAVLCATSPVFSVMLGPKFREGQVTRNAESPQEIDLPDDKADGVSDMCHLLHHKVEDILKAYITSTRLYHFAVTVDKYQCSEVLQLQSQGLFCRHLACFTGDVEWQVYVRRIGAAYILDQKENFEVATKGLIMCFTGKFSMITNEEGAEPLAALALLTMEERRLETQQRILKGLLELGMPKCDECANYDQHYVSNLEYMYNVRSLSEVFDHNISVLDAIGVLRDEGSVSRKGKMCTHYNHRTEVLQAELQAFAFKMEAECCGICLKCLKEGRDLGKWCSAAAHDDEYTGWV